MKNNINKGKAYQAPNRREKPRWCGFRLYHITLKAVHFKQVIHGRQSFVMGQRRCLSFLCLFSQALVSCTLGYIHEARRGAREGRWLFQNGRVFFFRCPRAPSRFDRIVVTLFRRCSQDSKTSRWVVREEHHSWGSILFYSPSIVMCVRMILEPIILFKSMLG